MLFLVVTVVFVVGLAGVSASPALACEDAGVRYGEGDEACIHGQKARCTSDNGRLDWRGSGEECGFRIEIASAKYGAADQWCSATAWVENSCNGRWNCKLTVPEVSADLHNLEERSEVKRAIICGPLNTVNNILSVAWYCSDGQTYLGQPRVAIKDGGKGQLTCGQPQDASP